MNNKDVVQNIFELFEELNLKVKVSKLTFMDKAWTYVEVSNGPDISSAIDSNFDEAFYSAASKLFSPYNKYKPVVKKVKELKSQSGCGGCCGCKEENNLFAEEDNKFFETMKGLHCNSCLEPIDKCICVGVIRNFNFKDDEPVELTVKKDPPKSKKKNKKTTEKLIEEFNKQVTKIETAKSKK